MNNTIKLKDYFLKKGLRPTLLLCFALSITTLIILNIFQQRQSVVNREGMEEKQLNFIREKLQNEAGFVNERFEAMRHKLMMMTQHQTQLIKYESQEDLDLPANYEIADSKAIFDIGTEANPEESTLTYTNIRKLPLNEAIRDIVTSVKQLPLMKEIVDNVSYLVAAWSVSVDGMMRYYPWIDSRNILPHDMNVHEYNFIYLSNPKHNPERSWVWLSAYLDPAGQGWMVSCVSPVYKGDVWRSVCGIDITLGNLATDFLREEITGIPVSGFFVDDSGTIIDMNNSAKELLGLKQLDKHDYGKEKVEVAQMKPETFNLKTNKKIVHGAEISKNLGKRGYEEIQTSDGMRYLISESLSENSWTMFYIVDKEDLSAQLAPLQKAQQQQNLFYQLLLLVIILAFGGMLYLNFHKIGEFVSQAVYSLQKHTSDFREKRPCILQQIVV